MKMFSASHILVSHEFEAKDLLRKLEQGESFDKLAQDYSLCSSKANGGFLGEFGKGKMVPEFEKALLALKPGSISPPIRTRFGYHIIKRIA